MASKFQVKPLTFSPDIIAQLKKGEAYELPALGSNYTSLYIPARYVGDGEVRFIRTNNWFSHDELNYVNYKIISYAKESNLKIGDEIVVVIKLTTAQRRFYSVRSFPNEESTTEEKSQIFTPVEKPKNHNGFIEGIYFTEEQKVTFDTAYEMASQWGYSTLLLAGDSGNGKTSMSEAYASHKGMDYCEIACGLIRDSEEWFGTREFKEGETVFLESDFIKAVKRGNVIICLDELNRTETWNTSSLYTLLSHGRTLFRGEEIKVGPNIIFTATMNIGSQFTGIFPLDEALRNRFVMNLMVETLPASVEAQVLVNSIGVSFEIAQKIVNVMIELRQVKKVNHLEYDASTRTSKAVAMMVKAKMPLVMAFKNAFRMVESDVYKNIVDILAVKA